MIYRPVENIVMAKEQKKDRFSRLQAVPVSGGGSNPKVSTVNEPIFRSQATAKRLGLSDYD